MAGEIPTVPVGSLAIDCSGLAAFLEDLPPGARQGMRTTQDGYVEAVGEIVSNQAVWGSEVGVTAADISAIELADQRVATIDAYLPAVRKLVEMLEESRSKIDDERHRRIAEIAELIDARSKRARGHELVAAYEKTRTYRSAAALKGVRTRRRNAATTEQENETDIQPE